MSATEAHVPDLASWNARSNAVMVRFIALSIARTAVSGDRESIIPKFKLRHYPSAASLAAVAIPASMALAAPADAELLRLYGELRTKWAAERTVRAIEPIDEPAIEAAIAATSAVVDRIEETPATTMRGLQAKAAAFMWCHGGNLGFSLSDHRTTDIRLAESERTPPASLIAYRRRSE
jgi:hypothetical protein